MTEPKSLHTPTVRDAIAFAAIVTMSFLLGCLLWRFLPHLTPLQQRGLCSSLIVLGLLLGSRFVFFVGGWDYTPPEALTFSIAMTWVPIGVFIAEWLRSINFANPALVGSCLLVGYLGCATYYLGANILIVLVYQEYVLRGFYSVLLYMILWGVCSPIRSVVPAASLLGFVIGAIGFIIPTLTGKSVVVIAGVCLGGALLWHSRRSRIMIDLMASNWEGLRSSSILTEFVQSHGEDWSTDDFDSLIDRLKSSQFWPVWPDDVDDELFQIVAERRSKRERKAERKAERMRPKLYRVIVFKSGRRPLDQQWYLREVLDAMGLTYKLGRADLKFHLMDVGDHDLDWQVRDQLIEEGVDLELCTRTPFRDAEGGSGILVKCFRISG